MRTCRKSSPTLFSRCGGSRSRGGSIHVHEQFCCRLQRAAGVYETARFRLRASFSGVRCRGFASLRGAGSWAYRPFGSRRRHGFTPMPAGIPIPAEAFLLAALMDFMKNPFAGRCRRSCRRRSPGRGALLCRDGSLKLFPVHLSVAVLIQLFKTTGAARCGRGTQGSVPPEKPMFHSGLPRISPDGLMACFSQ